MMLLFVAGPVKLVKGSVASTSRKKRNIRKHSFDQSLSATSAKMARLDDDKKSTPTPLVSHTYNTHRIKFLTASKILF